MLVYISRFHIKCGCQLSTRGKTVSAHQYHLFVILLCLNTEDNKSDPTAHLKKKHIARFLLEPAYAAYQNIKYSILSYYKSENAV